MASNNSIRRAFFRPGHFLSLLSDRLLYLSPVRSLGGFSVSLFARIGSHTMAPELHRALNPTLDTRRKARPKTVF